MPEGNEMYNVDQVLRTLVSASRSLRLYPTSSPIPRQSVEAVTTALANVFAEGARSLPIAIARAGFQSGGQPAAVGVPGGTELSDDLRAQGISALEFESSVTGDDILKMLMVLARPAEEVRAEGGFSALVAGTGARGIRISQIQLTVVDTPSGEGDISGMEASTGAEHELASDPAKLGAWLTGIGGDAATLQSRLLAISQEVHPEGEGDLAGSLSATFGTQPAETRDALLGLAMEPGPFRDLMGEMLRRQSAAQIAASILGGSYGRNMLSLSNALTSLPLDRLDDAVREQIASMLPGAGHSDAEARFLDHMIEVRRRKEPERALTAVDQTYLAVARASAIEPQDLDTASRALQASGQAIDAAGVRTMLILLDQQPDAAQARTTAESLAKMVPRLVASGQLALADYVVDELAARSDRIPAAELMPSAATSETLSALVDAALKDPEARPMAERILSHLGEAADADLVAAAIAHKAPGLQFVEGLLGKRLIELLNGAALQAQWFQLGDVVARLAQEGDSRCAATIESLMRRPDAQARKEVVSGLAAAGGPIAAPLLGELVRDANPDVAIAAARELAKGGLPGAGAAISARLSQLDVDNADFELARELIEALARTPDAAAGETLAKLASRRSLIKRGHFTDVQVAVTAALQLRAREPVPR